MTRRPPVGEEPGRVPTITIVPYDLQVEPGDQRMVIRWKKGGAGLLSGYNIYIGEQPGARKSVGADSSDTASPYNTEPFPGDTNPDDSVETYEADHLENGRKYYVLIRAIRPDGSLSGPSNEQVAVCGPRVEINLTQRYSGNHDGYSLNQNTFVRADAAANDFYFYAKDGIDYLASPKRLNGYLRGSRFVRLDMPGELRDIAPALAKADPNPTGDRIAIKTGDWVLVRTQDDTNAIMKVLGFSGTGQKREVQLFVAFCPLAGALLF